MIQFTPDQLTELVKMVYASGIRTGLHLNYEQGHPVIGENDQIKPEIAYKISLNSVIACAVIEGSRRACNSQAYVEV